MKQFLLFLIIILSFEGCNNKRNVQIDREFSGYELKEKKDWSNDEWAPFVTTERPVIKKNMERLIGAIVNNDKKYVINHICYPIEIGDGYPLRTVINAKEMSLIYDKVFDDSLRSVISQHMDLSEYIWTEKMGWHSTFSDSTMILLPNEGTMSAYGSYLWFIKDDNDSCFISTINYVSSWEKEERDKLLRLEFNSLHKKLQNDSIEPLYVFKAVENGSTTWIGRVDIFPYYYYEKSFQSNGKSYPLRIALYKNYIKHGLQPVFIYYGDSDYQSSGGNYLYKFFDKYGNNCVTIQNVAIGPVDTKFGNFFFIDGKGPMECKKIYWLDELERK